MPEPKAIEVVVRDEPIAFTREYKGDGKIKLMIGESGALARIRYEPVDSFPGVERIKERLRNCPLCLVTEKLNSSRGSSNHGGNGMAWRETGIIVGSQHIAKGINKAFDIFVDPAVGKDTRNLIELGVGTALVLLPRFVRMGSTLDMVLTVIGGQMTTKVWDYVESKLTPTAAAVFVPAPAPAPAPVPAPAPAPTAPSAPAYQPAGPMLV